MASDSGPGLLGGLFLIVGAVCVIAAVVVLAFFLLIYLAMFAAGAGAIFGGCKASGNYVKSFKSNVIDSNRNES